jgi:hypothetical protein
MTYFYPPGRFCFPTTNVGCGAWPTLRRAESNDRFGEGFRMPAHRRYSRAALRAGLRKPPRKEPAGRRVGGRCLWGFDRAAAWIVNALAGIVTHHRPSSSQPTSYTFDHAKIVRSTTEATRRGIQSGHRVDGERCSEPGLLDLTGAVGTTAGRLAATGPLQRAEPPTPAD